MNCKKCQTAPVWKFTNKRQLCNTCFIKYFEKKARKTIKKYSLIGEKEKVYSKEEPLTSFIKEYLQDKTRLVKKKDKRTNIAIQETLDDTSAKIIYLISSKKISKSKIKLSDLYPVSKNDVKIIKPFYFLLSKEVELYARLKKKRYNKIECKNEELKKIYNQLNALEKEHPEIKNSIVRGFLTLS